MSSNHYHLTLAEQETVILFDNEIDTAKVYTHDARLIRKLKELAENYPEQFLLLSKGPRKAVTYRVPKRCVGIRAPYDENRRNRQIQDAKVKGLPFSNNSKEADIDGDE